MNIANAYLLKTRHLFVLKNVFKFGSVPKIYRLRFHLRCLLVNIVQMRQKVALIFPQQRATDVAHGVGESRAERREPRTTTLRVKLELDSKTTPLDQTLHFLDAQRHVWIFFFSPHMVDSRCSLGLGIPTWLPIRKKRSCDDDEIKKKKFHDR